jgi:hypothetical protein
MMAILTDPATLALAFTASVFAVSGAISLAGFVRVLGASRGRAVHLLTLGHGTVALAVLGLLAFGVDIGPGLILGLIGGLGAVCFWLVGALVARARPVWADLLVIASALAFLTSYAAIADSAVAVPQVFPGITLPSPGDPQ